jgi:S1-C subfamily serine protease
VSGALWRSAIALLATLVLGAATTTAGSLLLDYQKTQAFRDRLVRAIFHVAVELEAGPGMDPTFPIRQTGAATLVRAADGREYFLTSLDVVRGARRITVSAGEGRTSPAEFVDAGDLRHIPPSGAPGPPSIHYARTVAQTVRAPVKIHHEGHEEHEGVRERSA